MASSSADAEVIKPELRALIDKTRGDALRTRKQQAEAAEDERCRRFGPAVDANKRLKPVWVQQTLRGGALGANQMQEEHLSCSPSCRADSGPAHVHRRR